MKENKLKMFAYVATLGKDVFKTEQDFLKYKNAGFDVLLLLGNDGYTGQDFNNTLLANLDLCQKTGLKCIVYDKRIHDLTISDSSLIGEGKLFANLPELQNTLKSYISEYNSHPSFYGVTIMDEPKYWNLVACGEVCRCIENIDKKIYINCVLFPLLPGTKIFYSENSEKLTDKEAYENYINDYFKNTERRYIDYDAYPFCINSESKEEEISLYYLYNLQTLTRCCLLNGKELYLTMQSHSSDNSMPGTAWKGEMRHEDFLWQLHIAFAFGVRDMRYYTYYAHPSDPMINAILSAKGDNQYYDEVKQINKTAKKWSDFFSEFNYKKTWVFGVNLLHTKNLELAEEKEFKISINGGTLICNKLVNNKTGEVGYYIVHGSPYSVKTVEASIEFSNVSNIKVIDLDTEKSVQLQDGRLSLTFITCQGYFIVLN